jgi:hypothetical protein
VLLPVLKHVEDRCSYFTGSAKQASVIAAGEERSTPAERAVYPPRNADGEAFEAAPKSAGFFGFHDEVEVVSLHGEVEQAELTTRRCRERQPDGAEEERLAERGQSRPHPHGDMHRTA